MGAVLALAAWSGTYVPTASGPSNSQWQVGAAAHAGVRWTPNPDRGSASSSLSGGRRSASASACALDEGVPDPAVTLLVPQDAIGLTTAAQPTLAWYLESQNEVEMEFMLSHPNQAEPVYTKSMRGTSGLIEVKLPAEVSLEPDTRYRWTVFVTCNGGQNRVHARSFVERVEAPMHTENISQMEPIEQASIYAAYGVWYDALHTLIDAYRQDKQMITLLELRALLEQGQTDVPLELSLAIES